MNFIIRSTKTSDRWLKSNAVVVNAVRNHWNKDYLVGPYPKTEKERALAAEKYGIPLEEYKPSVDDGNGVGDYPDFPLVSADSKDPFYPWDIPELKRNFNEVMHRQFDFVREDRFDCNLKLRRPMPMLWLEFFGVVSVLFGMYVFMERFKMSIPWIPKQYPNQGKIHYTFDLESDVE